VETGAHFSAGRLPVRVGTQEEKSVNFKNINEASLFEAVRHSERYYGL